MKKSLDTTPVDLEVMLAAMPQRHQIALLTISDLYGNASNDVINGLMDMTVRAAIMAGVSAEDFAAGMKAHWDAYAIEINKAQN